MSTAVEATPDPNSRCAQPHMPCELPVANNVANHESSAAFWGRRGPTCYVFGTQAEFVLVKQYAPVATMPAGVWSAEAAALCDGAILALACLRQAAVGPRSRIVVYGASGSIGNAAVQLAKHVGAVVNGRMRRGECRARASLGADTVLGCRHERFTETSDPYDVVLDAVAKLSFAQCRKPSRMGTSTLGRIPTSALHQSRRRVHQTTGRKQAGGCRLLL